METGQIAPPSLFHALITGQVPNGEFAALPDRAEKNVGDLFTPWHKITGLRKDNDVTFFPTKRGRRRWALGEFFRRQKDRTCFKEISLLDTVSENGLVPGIGRCIHPCFLIPHQGQ